MLSRQKKSMASRSQSPTSPRSVPQNESLNHGTNVTATGHQFGSYSILPPNSALTVQAKSKRDEQEMTGGTSGIESLAGFSMDDNLSSNRSASLQAAAYAQGSDIHIGTGQEKHLPHEAWHVVQQKQGRVSPTAQLDEREA